MRNELVKVLPLDTPPPPVEVVVGAPHCPRVHFSRSSRGLLDVWIEHAGQTLDRMSLTVDEQRAFIRGLRRLSFCGLPLSDDAVDPVGGSDNELTTHEKNS